MHWIGDSQAFKLTINCIERLGERSFYDAFFELLHDSLGVDQCMLFMLDGQGRMNCLISRNFLHEKVATPLAKSYIEQGYKNDPNLGVLASLKAGENRMLHLREVLPAMSQVYRDQFFSNPQLVDKVSIMTANGGNQYYLNLYRSLGRRTFFDESLFSTQDEARLLSSLVVQHYKLNESLRNEGPLAFLSDREREVCRGILAGKKLEAVAGDMGVATSSALTYRKRAYNKLGISSRGALFALCKDS